MMTVKAQLIKEHIGNAVISRLILVEDKTQKSLILCPQCDSPHVLFDYDGDRHCKECKLIW